MDIVAVMLQYEIDTFWLPDSPCNAATVCFFPRLVLVNLISTPCQEKGVSLFLTITLALFESTAALLAMQSAVLATAIPPVSLSVRLSVTRWYPIQTNEDRIMQSSLWCSKNTSFWCQQWLRATFPATEKCRLRPISALTSQPWQLAKDVLLSRIGSWPRAFQRLKLTTSNLVHSLGLPRLIIKNKELDVVP